jgi:hypothetical protein
MLQSQLFGLTQSEVIVKPNPSKLSAILEADTGQETKISVVVEGLLNYR